MPRRQQIVDEAAVLDSVGGYTKGGFAVNEREIDEGLVGLIDAAAVYLAAIQVDAGTECVRIGLIGDDADGARHGAGAEERSLRAVQDLDPLDVIAMQIRNAAVIAHRRIIDEETGR